MNREKGELYYNTSTVGAGRQQLNSKDQNDRPQFLIRRKKRNSNFLEKCRRAAVALLCTVRYQRQTQSLCCAVLVSIALEGYRKVGGRQS
jgi:hypothetical protein